MTSAGAPDPRLSMEERIYRREAIEFQRYRFIGEPLRLGKASLVPSALALLTILFCLFLLARASYVPALESRVVERQGPRMILAADQRGAEQKLHGATEAELRLPGRTLNARIRKVERVRQAQRPQLRIELEVKTLDALLLPGAAATIALPARPVIDF